MGTPIPIDPPEPSPCEDCNDGLPDFALFSVRGDDPEDGPFNCSGIIPHTEINVFEGPITCEETGDSWARASICETEEGLARATFNGFHGAWPAGCEIEGVFCGGFSCLNEPLQYSFSVCI